MTPKTRQFVVKLSMVVDMDDAPNWIRHASSEDDQKAWLKDHPAFCVGAGHFLYFQAEPC